MSVARTEDSRNSETIAVLIRDLEAARQSEAIMRETLTRCQEQCTQLLLHNREMTAQLQKQQEIAIRAIETAFEHGQKRMAIMDEYLRRPNV